MTQTPFLLDRDLPVGTVYGVLLNDRNVQQRLSPQFETAPYKAAPRAPVLYIKPRNTHAGDGAVVRVPSQPGEVRVDATIGLVIGRRAARLAAADALTYLAGYVLVSDVTLPHDNYYRPAIRQRCRDGFCPMGQLVRAEAGFDPETATLTVEINGNPVYRRDFGSLVRPAAQLLADVTEFMTLSEGDVLLLGADDAVPLARPGDAVRIAVPGLGHLTHRIETETNE